MSVFSFMAEVSFPTGKAEWGALHLAASFTEHMSSHSSWGASPAQKAVYGRCQLHMVPGTLPAPGL